MDNEIKKQKGKQNNKNKHTNMKKNNNSNLDWYYKNHYNKNNKNKKSRKNTSSKENIKKTSKKPLTNNNAIIEPIKKNIKNQNETVYENNNLKTNQVSLPIKKESKLKKKKEEKVIVTKKKISFFDKINFNKKDKDNSQIKKSQKIKIDEEQVQNFNKKDKSSDTDKLKNKENVLTNDNSNSKYRSIYGSMIPAINNKEKNKIRRKIIFKESLIYASLFSFLNLMAYFFMDKAMIIGLTNKTFLNIIITFIISFVIIFIVTYFVDYLITKLMVVERKKKNVKEDKNYKINSDIINNNTSKEGDSNKNRRTIGRKGKKDI